MTQTRNKAAGDFTDEQANSGRALRALFQSVAGGIFLLVAVLSAYSFTIRHGGWIWDDDAHVTGNPALRKSDSLRDIWTDPKAVPPKQYYPLVHTTFWLQYPRGDGAYTCNLHDADATSLKMAMEHEAARPGHLMEPAAWPFHLVNILLHAVSAIILWRILRTLQIPGAFVAAAIWALHPINVESVAWITERKNVLSGLFYFLAAAAYLRFESLRCRMEISSNPQAAIRYPKSTVVPSPWPWYAAALLLFSAALFSKTTASSLPAAILLVLWWKRGRLSIRAIWPTIPLFVIGALLGLNTSRLETSPYHVGAVGADWNIPYLDRFLIAGRAIWFYPWKLLWPSHLMFSYERWPINPRLIGQWVYPLAALWLLMILVVFIRRLSRGPLVAMLFYGGTVLPAIGLFTLYPMRYTFVADHYVYIASVGLIVPLVAGMAKLLSRSSLHPPRWSIISSAALLLAGLAMLTWFQSRIYASAETLWADTLAKNPASWLARLHLVRIWTNEGRNLDQAIAMARENMKVRPNEEFLYGQYASALNAAGRKDDARDAYLLMLQKFPRSPQANHNLAVIYLDTNRLPEAVYHFRKELDVNRDPRANLITRSALAHALWSLGLRTEAEDELWSVVRGDPSNSSARYILAGWLLRRGDAPRAIQLLREVVLLNPRFVDARLALAQSLFDSGQYREAKAEFDRCLRIDPDNSTARNGSQASQAMLNAP